MKDLGSIMLLACFFVSLFYYTKIEDKFKQANNTEITSPDIEEMQNIISTNIHFQLKNIVPFDSICKLPKKYIIMLYSDLQHLNISITEEDYNFLTTSQKLQLIKKLNKTLKERRKSCQ